MNIRPPADATAGHRIVQRLAYGAARVFFGSFVRLRVRGREHLPANGAWVLAANHLSPFDPFLLTLAAGRWIDWVAMIELYRHPLPAWIWRGFAAIPLDRARTSRAPAALALRRLRGGRVVGIFPEGGIRAGAASVLAGGRIQAGAGRLAQAARVPLVPAAIRGAETMTGVWGWLWPRRAFRVEVCFGPAVTTDGAPEAVAMRLENALRALTLALRP